MNTKAVKGMSKTMRNRLLRITSVGLTLCMLLGIVPFIHPAAAEPSNTRDGYKDPWNTFEIPSLTQQSPTDPPEFTYKEWTGENGNEDVFAVNRQPVDNTFASSAVVYDSVFHALTGAADFKKEESGYVQFLTGQGQNWQLTVVDNAKQKSSDGYDEFYDPSFVADEKWKTVQLPCSWTRQGFDYSIYTNGLPQWQTDEYRNATDAPLISQDGTPVGLRGTSLRKRQNLHQFPGCGGRVLRIPQRKTRRVQRGQLFTAQL